MNCCIVVPHYKQEALFAEFVPRLASLNMPCFVVDDGSGAESVTRVEQCLESLESFSLIKHQNNRGKGAAVTTGIYHASAAGFTHVLQIDADGQHDVNDVDTLIKYSKAHPESIVSGKPYFDDTAPKIRVYGRKITDFWTMLETLSLSVKDSLCGFRIYPIKQVEHIFDHYYVGPRMDFDTEILVKARWANIDLHFVSTKVIYHANPSSHFNYISDNTMLIRLHLRLMFGMLIRLPFLLQARIKAMFIQ